MTTLPQDASNPFHHVDAGRAYGLAFEVPNQLVPQLGGRPVSSGGVFLGIGNEGDVLTVQSNVPVWTAPTP